MRSEIVRRVKEGLYEESEGIGVVSEGVYVLWPCKVSESVSRKKACVSCVTAYMR